MEAACERGLTRALDYLPLNLPVTIVSSGHMAEVAWFSTLSHKSADNKETVYVMPFGY
jgi:hypothetical protein